MRKYSMLKPELLRYCDNLIKKHPKQKDEVIAVLDYIDSCFDKKIACPPNEWDIRCYEKDYIVFNNGLFFISIYQENGWFYTFVDSAPFFIGGRELRLPFSFRRGRYDAKLWCTANIFNALDIAFDLRKAVDNRVKGVEEKQFLPQHPYEPIIESDEDKACMVEAFVGEWLEKTQDEYVIETAWAWRRNGEFIDLETAKKIIRGKEND